MFVSKILMWAGDNFCRYFSTFYLVQAWLRVLLHIYYDGITQGSERRHVTVEQLQSEGSPCSLAHFLLPPTADRSPKLSGLNEMYIMLCQKIPLPVSLFLVQSQYWEFFEA